MKWISNAALANALLEEKKMKLPWPMHFREIK